MNKVCREYISGVKSFFPVIRKKEKKYLATLKTEVEDFCLENNILTLEELYKTYKSPADAAAEYYALAEPSDIIRQIEIRKWITGAVAILLVFIITGSVLYGIRQMNIQKIFRETDQFFEEYHEHLKQTEDTQTDYFYWQENQK